MTRALRWWAGGAVVVATAFAAGVATRPRTAPGRTAEERAEAARRAAEAPLVHDAQAPVVSAGRRARAAASAEEDEVAQALALGMPVAELFEQEARDGAWASAVEAAAGASFTQRLAAVAPWATRVTVACKSSLCKVTLPVDEARVRATMNRVQVVSIATGVSPFAERGDDGAWYAGVYVRFDGDDRAAAARAGYWTDGVRARFPGGDAQLEAWLAEDERRAEDAERQATAETSP